jgi:hypothetical protein
MRYNFKLTFKGLRSTFNGLRRGCALLAFVLCGCVSAAAQNTANVELLSVNGAGTSAGNAPSSAPRTSADGRFVVFESTASDLVSNDTNGSTSDIFVRDAQQQTTTLVSINGAGTGSGNASSLGADITPDGRYVLFTSGASDLVAGDANTRRDVFVRDLQQQTTTLVSVNLAGTGSAAGDSSGGFITPGGRYVVFTSNADNLVSGDSNQPTVDVFRRDLQTNTTALVSVNAAGTNGGNNVSAAAGVTPDGRYVLFVSRATDLVALAANGSFTDVYRRDLQTNMTALVSVNRTGTAGGNGQSYEPSMSDDGQVVAFTSRATNIGPNDNNETHTSVYTRDLTSSTTALASEHITSNPLGVPTAARPRLSADGRYVVYWAGYPIDHPLSSSNEALHDRVMRRDRQTGLLSRLPYIPTGICNGFNCKSVIYELSVSPDGRYVAYPQWAYRRLFPAEPPFSWDLVVVSAANGSFQVVSDRFVNSLNQPNSTTWPSIGNLPPSLKLPFKSGVKHSQADTNTTEDLYLFSPARGSKFRFVFGLGFSTMVQEAAGGALVEVRRNALFDDVAASVHLATSNSTATAGSDYVAVSQTLTFAPGESVKTFNVPLIDDQLYEDDETFTLTLSDPSPGDAVEAPSAYNVVIRSEEVYHFEFSAARYDVSEAAGRVTVTVNLVGEPALTQTARAYYRTINGSASSRSDYSATFGRLEFAPGEKSKTFDVLINDDAFVESEESLSLNIFPQTAVVKYVASSAAAQIFIASDDTAQPTSNPIDASQFFVAQHYRDFLSRQPDASGLQFWTAELDRLTAGCAGEPDAGVRARCVLFARAQVSTAFFLSIEFQQTSYEVIRFYQTSYGRAPSLEEFIADTQEISRGLVVGQPNWQATLEANKQKLADAWVTRADFVSSFGQSSDADYVRALFLKGAGDADAEPSLRDALVAGLAPGASPQETRATVLRKVADSRSVYNRQYNPAFVVTQYFGYLRRAPNDSPDFNYNGYNFWLDKLNQFSLAGEDVRDPVTALERIRRAQMVEAFLDSDEYRKRFGP